MLGSSKTGEEVVLVGKGMHGGFFPIFLQNIIFIIFVTRIAKFLKQNLIAHLLKMSNL